MDPFSAGDTMKPTSQKKPRLIILTLAILLAWGGATTAQEYGSAAEMSPWTPSRATGPTLSVVDALRLAIEGNPTIALVHQDSILQRGSLQEATGTFDGALLLETYFRYAQGELLPGVRKSIGGTRETFRILSTEFDRVAQDLLDQLEDGTGFVYLDCGASGIDLEIGGTPVCISGREAANLQLFIELANDFGYNALADAIVEASRREVANTAQALQLAAYASRVALRNFGTVPRVEEETTIFFQAAYSKVYRNGMVLSPVVGFEALKDNYVHKNENPAFGGKGIPDKYTAAFGLSLNVPLGKGRGKVSTGAPERAAGLNYDASLLSETHVMSQAAVQALVLYWRLVGAQENVALFERSAERQRELYTLADELVKIDEIAAVDLNQVRARIAQTDTFLSQARQSVVQARLDLAQFLGLEIDRVEDAPLASDPFPEVAPPETFASWEASQLAEIARDNRWDLSASETLQESSEVLAAAARSDLKRTFDLEFQVGYSGIYEGGSITQPVDLVNGVYEALFGSLAGPSVAVLLKLEWPFENNVALGRLEQAAATAQQSSIQARDLERVITDTTNEVVLSLRKAADEVQQRQASVDFYRQALGNEVEKFKLGQATAVDLILTEEKQTSAVFSLISAKQRYAVLLARLRYELGVLVNGRIEDGRIIIEQVDPDSLEFTSRRG
jgi:outer membrane protein TolC